jgi:hypothetical protein
MTKKHAPQYFICSLNFKSHNFQTKSPFKRVAPTYRGSTTLSFLVLATLFAEDTLRLLVVMLYKMTRRLLLALTMALLSVQNTVQQLISH